MAILAPRRTLSAISVAALTTVLLHAAPPAVATSTAPAKVERSYRCRYQATAYITFLSIPIFSRSGVGFGYADSAEQSGGPTGKLSLRFLSGSTPERAHGLNRFGFIQEDIAERDRATISAAYFGLMTANQEESLDAAKAALNANAQETVAFVAARAFIDSEKTSYSVRHLLLPSSYRGSNADELLGQVKAEFASSSGPLEKVESLNGQITGTFLNCLRQAILAEASTYRSRIVFNGKIFDFQAEKHSDAKTGSILQKAGLTSTPDRILQLTGTLRNQKTQEITSFRLWFAGGSADFLPLRFEFKAKSYLRLVFDQEPPAAADKLVAHRQSDQ